MEDGSEWKLIVVVGTSFYVLIVLTFVFKSDISLGEVWTPRIQLSHTVQVRLDNVDASLKYSWFRGAYSSIMIHPVMYPKPIAYYCYVMLFTIPICYMPFAILIVGSWFSKVLSHGPDDWWLYIYFFNFRTFEVSGWFHCWGNVSKVTFDRPLLTFWVRK